MTPEILKKGNTVAVIAPSLSYSTITQKVRDLAACKFAELELRVIFGKHVEEKDNFDSSSVASRAADLHAAFADKSIKAIFAVRGGWSANQLLTSIDWNLIKSNPKIFCGYSNITMLQNAIYTKTGLVTYSGPGYSSFGLEANIDYTIEYFKKCLMSDEPFEVLPSKQWSDNSNKDNLHNRIQNENDGFIVINEGEAQGKIIGGSMPDLTLLRGSEYSPSLKDTVLFLEFDIAATPQVFDRQLQSLILQRDFYGVKGIVLGRFQHGSGISHKLLSQIIQSKPQLSKIPIIANVDFGHTDPKITFPIGGQVIINTSNKQIRISR